MRVVEVSKESVDTPPKAPRYEPCKVHRLCNNSRCRWDDRESWGITQVRLIGFTTWEVWYKGKKGGGRGPLSVREETKILGLKIIKVLFTLVRCKKKDTDRIKRNRIVGGLISTRVFTVPKEDKILTYHKGTYTCAYIQVCG